MKTTPYHTAIVTLLAACALIAPAALGQTTTATTHYYQQRQIQQQIDAQRQEIQRLHDAQRRAKRDAYYCEPLPTLRVPAKYPLPMQPAAVPTYTTPAQQTQRSLFIQRVMADRTLSHEAKMRIVNPLLNATSQP